MFVVLLICFFVSYIYLIYQYVRRLCTVVSYIYLIYQYVRRLCTVGKQLNRYPESLSVTFDSQNLGLTHNIG